MLFIDARHTFRQIDRAHRDFLPEQIELLGNIVRLYRDEDLETIDGGGAAVKEYFPDGRYVDVPGLCKIATRAEIQAEGGLNRGRYTGTAAAADHDEDFTEKLEGLYEEFTRLSNEAHELRTKVDAASVGEPGPRRDPRPVTASVPWPQGRAAQRHEVHCYDAPKVNVTVDSLPAAELVASGETRSSRSR